MSCSLLPGAAATRECIALDRVARVRGVLQFLQPPERADLLAVAGALHAMGVGKGDVVSWQLPNWWEAVPLHFGILRCGAVSNPIVPIYRRAEVEFVLRQAQTKVFVHPAVFRGLDFRQMVAEMAPQLAALTASVVVRGDAAGSGSFEEMLRGGAAPAVERVATDPAVLMYTSGTTSDPKGVVHPHATLVRENHGCAESWGLTGADRIAMAAGLPRRRVGPAAPEEILHEPKRWKIARSRAPGRDRLRASWPIA